MFKHVILWQLKDELTPELKETVKREAKAALEGLVGQVPGLLSVQVNIMSATIKAVIQCHMLFVLSISFTLFHYSLFLNARAVRYGRRRFLLR